MRVKKSGFGRRRRRHCWCRCRRHHDRRNATGAEAAVENTASVENVSGLINIIVQVPINLGDANAFNDISGSATANNIL